MEKKIRIEKLDLVSKRKKKIEKGKNVRKNESKLR